MDGEVGLSELKGAERKVVMADLPDAIEREIAEEEAMAEAERKQRVREARR